MSLGHCCTIDTPTVLYSCVLLLSYHCTVNYSTLCNDCMSIVLCPTEASSPRRVCSALVHVLIISRPCSSSSSTSFFSPITFDRRFASSPVPSVKIINFTRILAVERKRARHLTSLNECECGTSVLRCGSITPRRWFVQEWRQAPSLTWYHPPHDLCFFRGRDGLHQVR